MEMDSIEANGHTALIESVSPENSVSTEVSGNCGIYGEPAILPRVGNEYQVEIPALVPASNYLSCSKNLDQVEISAMSIPLMWVVEEAENKDAALRARRAKEAGVGLLGDGPSHDKVDPKSVASEIGKGYRLVPGCPDKSWSEIERSSFILGLYVFGKNLALVKKLIGSKQMGGILLYYYGRFYGSDMYLRWRGCGKTRSRKCNYGQRIFTGSRHQELLSRLLVNASEECRNAVTEMSKAFGEGKLVVEEYVFSLEAKLGLCALVEAVGIGKGKRDLVGNAPETPKSHQAIHARREIPAGKPLSALTPKEILSILTGDFRLSKAKANDIFWESVWPRLLARGWHSEQPNPSTNYLVYLKPGVKQFSRSELSRGDDYYDSVTDILNLIASEPCLLEIDGFENGWTGETKSEHHQQEDQNSEQPREGFSAKQRRHCYLMPRTPSRDAGPGVKFTVVDTSRFRNGKVRELRSLPVKALKDYAFQSHYSEEEEGDDGDSSEVFDTRPDGTPKKRAFPANSSALLALPAYNGALAKRGRKFKPGRYAGPENNHDDNNRLGVAKRRKKLPLPGIAQQETCSDLSANVVVSQEKPSLSSTGSTDPPRERAQPRTFIDLNVPVSQTVEIDEVSVMGTTERQDRNKAEDEAPERESGAARRRHSTRNRPLTTKVLEAFAYGFMDPKQKRRSRDGFSGESPRPRASLRRVRPRVEPLPPPPAEESNSDLFDKLGVSSETG